MDRKELRIGNYVVDKNFPTLISEVEQLHSTHLVTSYSDSISFEDIFPIPITKIWLEKLGFRIKTQSQDIWKNDIIRMNIKGVSVFFRADKVEDIMVGSTTNKRIKHIHQVQNIYYAMYGMELTVNILNKIE